MSLIDLSSKAALVTGGSRGIGAATASMLAAAGAAVAITYKSRRGDAERVVQAIGRRALAIQADLAEPVDCQKDVDEAVESFGRLDILVANAGIWPADDVGVKDMDAKQWRMTLRVNLDSVFYCCRAALGVMKKGSNIVVVSSTAGQRGEAFHADYAATKGALISFVKSLAVEAAPDVRANAVAPGWTDTEMCREAFVGSGERGAGRREIERSIPLGRVAQPEDIAGPIVFLCCPLAEHITGEVLNVNGGSVLCG